MIGSANGGLMLLPYWNLKNFGSLQIYTRGRFYFDLDWASQINFFYSLFGPLTKGLP